MYSRYCGRKAIFSFSSRRGAVGGRRGHICICSHDATIVEILSVYHQAAQQDKPFELSRAALGTEFARADHAGRAGSYVWWPYNRVPPKSVFSLKNAVCDSFMLAPGSTTPAAHERAAPRQLIGGSSQLDLLGLLDSSAGRCTGRPDYAQTQFFRGSFWSVWLVPALNPPLDG